IGILVQGLERRAGLHALIVPGLFLLAREGAQGKKGGGEKCDGSQHEPLLVQASESGVCLSPGGDATPVQSAAPWQRARAQNATARWAVPPHCVVPRLQSVASGHRPSHAAAPQVTAPTMTVS